MGTLEERFKLAVGFIQALPPDGELAPSVNDKLEFYALFKQASEGPCKTKKPSMLNFVARKKWDAWRALGTLSKHAAMERYIAKFTKIAKSLKSPEAAAILEKLRPVGRLVAKL